MVDAVRTWAASELRLGPFDSGAGAPLGLTLEVAGEEVLAATIETIYNRRGLEAGLQAGAWREALLLCPLLCHGCSFSNTLAFVEAAEAIAGLRVPLRAHYLRYLFAESERAWSHLAAAGRVLSLLAGQESSAGALRAISSGLRRGIDLGTPGGRKLAYGGLLESVNPSPSGARQLAGTLGEYRRRASEMARIVLRERGIAARLAGFARVTKEQVVSWDLRGPLARACGIERDVRHEQPSGLLELIAAEEPGDPLRAQLISQQGGDAYSRLTIWLLEAIESLRVAGAAAAALPSGPVWLAPLRGAAEGAAGSSGRVMGARPGERTIFPVGEEALSRVEAPRGETTCVVVAGELGPRLAHFHTASYAALPAIAAVLPGVELGEVSLALASLDICLPCAEK